MNSYALEIIDDRHIIEKAQKKVQAKKDFWGHFIAYCCIMPFLFLVNMLTVPEFWWFLMPMGGWGAGLAIHYFSVYGITGINSDWEERQLEKEILRDPTPWLWTHRRWKRGEVPEAMEAMKGKPYLPAEYDLAAAKLAGLFKDNFSKFSTEAEPLIVEAGPVV